MTLRAFFAAACLLTVGIVFVAPAATAAECSPVRIENGDPIVVGPVPLDVEQDVPGFETTTPDVDTPAVATPDDGGHTVSVDDTTVTTPPVVVPDVPAQHVEGRTVTVPGQHVHQHREFGPVSVGGDRPVVGDLGGCVPPVPNPCGEPVIDCIPRDVVERLVAELELMMAE